MTKLGGSQYKVDGLTHYERNKEKYKAKNQARVTAIREYMRKRKEESGCVDCGIKDWRVLDFDHLRDKTVVPAHLPRLGWSLARIEAELDKCEVRCANCHRIVTWERKHATLV